MGHWSRPRWACPFGANAILQERVRANAELVRRRRNGLRLSVATAKGPGLLLQVGVCIQQAGRQRLLRLLRALRDVLQPIAGRGFVLDSRVGVRLEVLADHGVRMERLADFDQPVGLDDILQPGSVAI